jgi:hypothetical protein
LKNEGDEGLAVIIFLPAACAKIHTHYLTVGLACQGAIALQPGEGLIVGG